MKRNSPVLFQGAIDLLLAAERADLDARQRWVVAYSGGLDSSALLHALAHDPRAQQRGLRAIHVHHGWSPLADDWVRHCQQFAQRCAVPLTVLRVQMDRSDGSGLEAQARRARYSALAEELSADEQLLTAQHADDQAETVLLKLLRGAGLDGLAGMRARAQVHGVRILRPLLEVPRASLLAYAQEQQLNWLEDPSNADMRLARGWLRTQVLPIMHPRFPQLTQTLLQTSQHLAADARLLERMTGEALARCSGIDPQALNIDALLAQPVDLHLRILRAWLHRLEQPAPPVRLLQRVLRELPGLAADCEPVWQYGRLRLQRYRQVLYANTQADLAPTWMLDWDGRPLDLPLQLGRLQWSLPTMAGASARSPVQSGGAEQPEPERWRLRTRRGGERLRVRGVHRPLKKLLQELAVPPWQRTRLVLLFERLNDDREVLRAVLGVVLDDELRERMARSGRRLLWQPAGIAADPG